MSNKHRHNPPSAAARQSELRAPLAEQLAGKIDELTARVADGTASPDEIELAQAGNVEPEPEPNPFDALFGVPEQFHFRPQDSSKGKELKDGSVRRYLAKTDAIGAMMSAELTITSSEKLEKTNEGTFKVESLDVWFPRGIVAVGDQSNAWFDDYKQRILNQYDSWCEARKKAAGNVLAVSSTGARLVRRTPIQAAA
jgi:hypothetical protein